VLGPRETLPDLVLDIVLEEERGHASTERHARRAARKSATQTSTSPASIRRETAAPSPGTRALYRSTGNGEAHERASATAKRALPCLASRCGNSTTRSHSGSAAASPPPSPGACVVTTVTRCRRDSSATV
jgi:hypothetical protein